MLTEPPVDEPGLGNLLVYPLLGSHTTFEHPDLHDYWSAQTLCQGGDCRSYVHAPVLVFPVQALAPTSIHAIYKLSGGDSWIPGGVAYSQGINIHSSVHIHGHDDEKWGQLWSWDLALKHEISEKPSSICIKLFGHDHLTLSTADLHEGPWCFNFADLSESEPSLIGQRLLVATPPPAIEESNQGTNVNGEGLRERLAPYIPVAVAVSVIAAIIASFLLGTRLARRKPSRNPSAVVKPISSAVTDE